MPDEYRVTIRLSPELYTQLEARGSHGQPLAAIVRDALVDYLSRQPEQPQSTAETATTLAAMAAKIQELHIQVEHLTARLDTLAASEQPPAASEAPMAAIWQPAAASGQQQPRPATRPAARHGLPRETLQAIADERTHCEGLSLREFAQRLHDKGIYSATAKDGSRVPANPGNITKWLEQARRAGVL